MDLQRVRVWNWLAALTGVVLFVSLWLPWYGSVGLTANAWEAFTFVDLVLALTGLVAIAVVPVTATARAAAGPRLLSSFLFWLALAGAVLAVLRLINVPGVDTILAGGGADITREAGAFVGAAAAIATAVFAWLSRRDRSFPGPLRTHPEIERLPPPTAEPVRRDA